MEDGERQEGAKDRNINKDEAGRVGRGGGAYAT